MIQIIAKIDEIINYILNMNLLYHSITIENFHSRDFTKKMLTSFSSHHKLNGSRFDNNSHAKSNFHRFVWNKHGCHSSTCDV